MTALLALIINPWWWTAVSVIIAFWAGPFTPAVPLQIALALGLKKIHDVIKKRRVKHGKSTKLKDTNLE